MRCLAPFRIVTDLIFDPPSLQQRAKEIALSFLKHEMIIAAETLADVWDIIGAPARGASSRAGFVLLVCSVCLFRWFVCSVCLFVLLVCRVVWRS